jgi:cation:H+ antiporter
MAALGIILAMIIIWKACDSFESATSYLGRNLSNGVRGATLNAIGSSLPELLATSLALLFYVNKEGFAFGIGTTAGSAMFNSAVIPSLVIGTVLIAKLAFMVKVSRKVVLRDGLSLLACELGLIYVLTNPVLSWQHGFILLFMYFTYVFVLFGSMDKKDLTEKEEYEPEIKKLPFFDYHWTMNTPSAWLLFIASTTVIGAACYILVESCYHLGDTLGIQTYFIAVILAAGATSVPEHLRYLCLSRVASIHLLSHDR